MASSSSSCKFHSNCQFIQRASHLPPPSRKSLIFKNKQKGFLLILHADEICKEREMAGVEEQPLHIQLLKLITSIAILPLSLSLSCLFPFRLRCFWTEQQRVAASYEDAINEINRAEQQKTFIWIPSSSSFSSSSCSYK